MITARAVIVLCVGSAIGVLITGKPSSHTSSSRAVTSPGSVKQSLSLSLSQSGSVHQVEVEGLEDEYSAPKLSLSTSNKRSVSPRSAATTATAVGVLGSCEELERCYLQLTYSLVAHYTRAGRPRFAALIQQRRAELMLAQSCMPGSALQICSAIVSIWCAVCYIASMQSYDKLQYIHA
eukprot:18985-Heterococcus_DN1.PRE.2